MLILWYVNFKVKKNNEIMVKECLCDSWVMNNFNLFVFWYIGNLLIIKVLEILF